MSNANHRAAGIAGALIMALGPLARESLVELHLEGMIVTEHASLAIAIAERTSTPPEELVYRVEDLRVEVPAFPFTDKKPRRRGQRESIRAGFDKHGRRG